MLLPKDYVRLRLTGEQAIDVERRVGHAAVRRRRAGVERAAVEALDSPADPAARARVAGGVRADVRRRPGRRRRRRPGGGRGRRRRRRRRAGRCRSRSAPAAWSSPRCPRSRPTRRRACTRSAMPCRDLARDGRDAQRGGRAALAARRDGRRRLRRADAEAGPWEPGVEGLTFLPYLAGERTPHADPDARGAFVGLSLRHDRGALAAPCWRAWRSACATRWTCCASWA